MPLQRILSTLRNIQSKIEGIINTSNYVNVAIEQDDVGLAKDTTLTKLTNALNSVGSDDLLAIINGDNVGILKDATFSDSIMHHVTTQPFTLSNAGTSAAWYPVFSTAISLPDDADYTILIALDTATTVKLDITYGTNTYSYLLNGGNALSADAWYAFIVPAAYNDKLNIEINVPAGASVSGIVRIFKRR